MAIRCANCKNDALYTCADPGVNPVNYCGSCLPNWLKARADAGQFPLVERVTGPVPGPDSEEEEEEEPEKEDK